MATTAGTEADRIDDELRRIEQEFADARYGGGYSGVDFSTLDASSGDGHPPTTEQLLESISRTLGHSAVVTSTTTRAQQQTTIATSTMSGATRSGIARGSSAWSSSLTPNVQDHESVLS